MPIPFNVLTGVAQSALPTSYFKSSENCPSSEVLQKPTQNALAPLPVKRPMLTALKNRPISSSSGNVLATSGGGGRDSGAGGKQKEKTGGLVDNRSDNIKAGQNTDENKANDEDIALVCKRYREKVQRLPPVLRKGVRDAQQGYHFKNDFASVVSALRASIPYDRSIIQDFRHFVKDEHKAEFTAVLASLTP
uniref:Uncharacterized protein n=1 Tax=Panagrellus redivivus TaxID=6233 RepID=A0A7E4VF22_PANRE